MHIYFSKLKCGCVVDTHHEIHTLHQNSSLFTLYVHLFIIKTLAYENINIFKSAAQNLDIPVILRAA